MSSYTSYTNALDQHALKKPKDVAFRFLVSDSDIREITYGDLQKNAKTVARHLLKNHQKGDRALLIFNPGLELIQAMVGCFYAGVIPLLHYPPTNQKLTDKINKIADNAGAHLLISPKELLEKMKGFTFSNGMTYQEFESLEAPIEEEVNLPKLTPQDVAFLQYTSGSTGDPKGVVITHENIMDNCEVISIAYGLSKMPHTSVVSWLPPYHDMGLIGCILAPLFVGKPSTLLSPTTFLLHPLKWLKAITTYKGTSGGGPNFAYDYCVERIKPEDKKHLDLSTWVCAFNGAEPIQAATLDRFYEYFKECGLKKEFLYPCYGMAEITLMASANELNEGPTIAKVSLSALQDNKIIPPQNDSDVYKYVSSGRPRVPTYIVDPTTLEALKDNQIGEIWLSGKSKAAGYWKKPKETKETFHAHLKGITGDFLRTGDLGFMRDGHLYVSGRMKDLIILHGKNYYPQDIEAAAARSNPYIKSAGTCAFSYEDNKTEKVCVMAEVTSKDDSLFSDITDSINQALLSDVGIMADLVVLLPTRALPKTTSGKVQRKKTKQLLLDNDLPVLFKTSPTQEACDSIPLSPSEAAQPKTDQHIDLTLIEKHLKQKIESLLQLPKNISLKREDNFFEMGMDSLLAQELAFFIQKQFNIKIKISETIAMEHGTLEELSLYVASLLGVKEAGPFQKVTDVVKASQIAFSDFVSLKTPDFSELESYKNLLEQKKSLKKFQMDKVFMQETQGVSNREITINDKNYLNYSGYNYLNFSGDPKVIKEVKKAIDEYGTSGSASRLVSGNKVLHSQLESQISSFLKTKDAIVFSAGHATNVCVITHFMQEGDVIFYDSLSHNSLSQGIRFSGCAKFSFSHNDPSHLEKLLKLYRNGYKKALIVVEGVYSMDGDIADLPAFVALKEKYGCWLMVDEAHSLGTIGKKGGGVLDHFNLPSHSVDILMGTLSKSLGSCGGYIAGSKALVDNLKYKGEGFVFSAAISPANTAAALSSLKLLKKEPGRVQKLQQNAHDLLMGFKELGLNTGKSSKTPIIPVILPTQEQTLMLSSLLRQNEILAMPILYPAVERHLTRVRFFVTSSHTKEDITKTLTVIKKILPLLEKEKITLGNYFKTH